MSPGRKQKPPCIGCAHEAENKLKHQPCIDCEARILISENRIKLARRVPVEWHGEFVMTKEGVKTE